MDSAAAAAAICLLPLLPGAHPRHARPRHAHPSAAAAATPASQLKVYVYELPRRYNEEMVEKDPRCLSHMFAAEIFLHTFLMSSPSIRTMDPREAHWFFTPVYTTCDLTPNGLPLPFQAPRMMRSAIQFIATRWPFWNRTQGADHFFIAPHDFGACFHYKVPATIVFIIISYTIYGGTNPPYTHTTSPIL